MKKFLFVVALALPLSMSTVSAQSAATKVEKAAKTATKKAEKKESHDAPAAVKAAFKQRFPTVTKVAYDLEKNGEYEAEFKINGVEMSANFTPDGTWRETETAIPVSALPVNIAQVITTKYPTATVVGAAKIELSDNSTHYEADLKTAGKKSEVVFDATGNVVK